jgi:2-keto-4-pentenoate hydratase/2-oxohepta-3-ene-1,7-dioic acid hydratase in catechol pathway
LRIPCRPARNAGLFYCDAARRSRIGCVTESRNDLPFDGELAVIIGKRGRQRLETRLNGEEMQKTTLEDLLFDEPTIIEYCSTFTEPVPGDALVTNTTISSRWKSKASALYPLH